MLRANAAAGPAGPESPPRAGARREDPEVLSDSGGSERRLSPQQRAECSSPPQGLGGDGAGRAGGGRSGLFPAPGSGPGLGGAGGAVDVVDLDGISVVSSPGCVAPCRFSGGSGVQSREQGREGGAGPASVPLFFGLARALPSCRSTYRFPASRNGTGNSQGVQFTTEDLQCLEPGEFLNDTLLDMCLEWERAAAVQKRALAGGRALRVHVMGTFFYKKLTLNNGVAQPQPDRAHEGTDPECSKTAEARAAQVRLTRAERTHARVQGWTKGVNLFDQDYVLVPICAGAHWSLAVICHPGALPPSPPSARRARGGGGVGLCRSPCILHLDSLPGGHATQIITRTIREYLWAEWRCKALGVEPCLQPEPRSFTPEEMPAKRLVCPQQSNLCDCGLFVLKNAQKFLHDPPEAVEWVRPVRNPRQVTFLFHGYDKLAYDKACFSPSDVAAYRLELYSNLLRYLGDDPKLNFTQETREAMAAGCELLDASAAVVRTDMSALGVRKSRPEQTGAVQPIDLTQPQKRVRRAARKALRTTLANKSPLKGTVAASDSDPGRLKSDAPHILLYRPVPSSSSLGAISGDLDQKNAPTPPQGFASRAMEAAEPALLPPSTANVPFMWDSGYQYPRRGAVLGGASPQEEEACPSDAAAGGMSSPDVSHGSFRIAPALDNEGGGLFLRPGGAFNAHL